MKRNSKRFLALFMAVSMSVTPTTVLHAEESSETDQIQNVEIKQDEIKKLVEDIEKDYEIEKGKISISESEKSND